MKIKQFALYIGILLVLSATAYAKPTIKQPTYLPDGRLYQIEFNSGALVNTFSDPINTCPTMSVTFFESTDVGVSLYETDPDDDTLAEIEALTALTTFTASTTAPFVFRPGKMQLRFVVDNDESSGTSIANVVCINEVARSETLFEGSFRSLTSGALDATACVALNGHDGGANVGVIDANLPCSSGGTSFGTRAGMWIDEMSTIETSSNTHVSRSCALCLTIDGGANCIAGTTLEHPSTASGGEFSAAGEGEIIRPNVFIPGGSVVQLLVGDGTECTTAPCFCNSSTRNFIMKIKGRDL
jgi:hypothetical protein